MIGARGLGLHRAHRHVVTTRTRRAPAAHRPRRPATTLDSASRPSRRVRSVHGRRAGRKRAGRAARRTRSLATPTAARSLVRRHVARSPRLRRAPAAQARLAGRRPWPARSGGKLGCGGAGARERSAGAGGRSAHKSSRHGRPPPGWPPARGWAGADGACAVESPSPVGQEVAVRRPVSVMKSGTPLTLELACASRGKEPVLRARAR